MELGRFHYPELEKIRGEPASSEDQAQARLRAERIAGAKESLERSARKKGEKHR